MGSAPAGRIGVLVANLGTPEAPTPAAVRRYLREFLGDPRVVELPRLPWLLVLNLLVLPLRSRRSARLYGSVWTADGSPLLSGSRRLATAIGEAVARETGAAVPVELGMRYGRPSIASALRSLAATGCDRIAVLPLFPQYSGTTTGSVFDAVATELRGWRSVPGLTMIRSYHDDGGYIEALAASVRGAWAEGGEPDRLVLSFHGLPERYVRAGDPYQAQCRATASLLAAALGMAADRLLVTYQSRFGREPWLQPCTDRTLQAFARTGVAAVDVLCPGFAVDCLETLEEIGMLNRRLFLAAGGRRFRYIPALNAGTAHADLLARLVVGSVRPGGHLGTRLDAEETG